MIGLAPADPRGEVISLTGELGADWVPCQIYEEYLDQLEQEVGGIDRWPAARELWFVRWSREALRLYGDRAAFGAWGELR